MVKRLTVLVSTISDSQVFLTYMSYMLTNDIVSFEQLGPDFP